MKRLMMAMAMAMTANVFGSFSYQGALRNADGSSVSATTTVNRSIEFRLYATPTGGTPLWSGVQTVVIAPSNGLFNVEIGDTMPKLSAGDSRPALDDLLAANASLYIGLTVENSSGEITPRQRILPVPVASFAQNVRQTRGDFTVASNLVVQGSAVVSNATFSGDVNLEGRLSVKDAEVLPVPVGGIIMWSSPNAPNDEAWAAQTNTGHWAICDGRKIGTIETPDLRRRFVVGADPDAGQGDYRLKATGGAEKVTLSIEEMPKHAHDYKFTGADLEANWDNDNYFYNQSEHYTGNKNTKSTEATGGGQPHENRPPYYALYYIMRVR